MSRAWWIDFAFAGGVAASVYAPVFLERVGAFDAIHIRIAVLALQGIAIVPFLSVVRREGLLKSAALVAVWGAVLTAIWGGFAALEAAWPGTWPVQASFLHAFFFYLWASAPNIIALGIVLRSGERSVSAPFFDRPPKD